MKRKHLLFKEALCKNNILLIKLFHWIEIQVPQFSLKYSRGCQLPHLQRQAVL